MLKKEYNNTDYTVAQINNAVEQIVNNEKSDYKIEGYHPDSVMLLCRTGYNWSIITEIMWDKVDANHLDIIIECRNSIDNASAVQVQHEYEERHLNKISDHFFKYVNSPIVPVKEDTSSAKMIGIILGILIILLIVSYFVYKTMG